MFFGTQKWPERSGVVVNGKTIKVTIRLHPRARHYRLSLSRTGEPVLSVPPKGRWRDAKKFLDRQGSWLAARLENHPEAVIFADGVEILYRGAPVLIRGTGKLRGHVECVTANNKITLLVPGGERHLARRLTDWLKSQAKDELELRTSIHADRLGVTPKSIRVRGQSTRWGSCSSTGGLNYNWRLILAPAFVLDYVAAHEVAHLREMNHSPAFWAKVTQTLPDMERGRSWLKANGSELMAYGATG